MEPWIAGYGDRISVRPGESVSFMASACGIDSYDVDILRIISAEDDPAGPGCNMPIVAKNVVGRVRARVQPVFRGSYGHVRNLRLSKILDGDFSVAAFVFPTTPAKGSQSLISVVDANGANALNLHLDTSGSLAAEWRDSRGESYRLSTSIPLISHTWYLVALTWRADEQRLILRQVARPGLVSGIPAGADSGPGAAPPALPEIADVYFAAKGRSEGSPAGALYNGKIDTPAFFSAYLTDGDLQAALEDPLNARANLAVVAMWDFSAHVASREISEVTGSGAQGFLENLPTSAVTGWLWNGEHFHWRDCPAHYRAIHFHDDDLYDAKWQVDFVYTVPSDLPSGIYAARLNAAGAEDHVPFVVRRAHSAVPKSVAFLVPDASYMAYANYLEHLKTPDWFEPYLGGLIELSTEELLLQEHPEFDGCLYSVHSDGSGFNYSSRLRPLLNMRPRFRSTLGGRGCGAWQFKGDSHIWAWLSHVGVEFDVLCDEDLDRDGCRALDGHQVLITGTHPEYCSGPMRTAIEQFVSRGGRLMYLGGNGFYWKVAYDKSHPGVVELRRGESGARAWASRPGESYLAFGTDPNALGGLWRNSGRAPNTLTGVGFTAQGFDVSAPYRRQSASREERAKFIFEGVDEELIGTFGLVGGGAAGLEIDRADADLGTPAHALVLASSEGHSPHYLLTVEDVLEMHPFVSADVTDTVRADLVFFETAGGGAVFSTGSIAWGGALSHNNYDNCVARITENTLHRFMSSEPFELPLTRHNRA